MQDRPEKTSVNGTRVVKKEGGFSIKANGAPLRRDGDVHGLKKEMVGKSSTNGVKYPVKKENQMAAKPNGTVTSVKKEVDSSVEKKREASTSGVKTIVKKTVSSTKTTLVKTEEKKEKKVFTLPGQKHEAPEERDPLRIFYESLHEQKPESEMAEFWMMEHGLLTPEHARKALEKKQRRQQNGGTPIKSTTSSYSSSRVVVSKTSFSNGRQNTSKSLELKGKRKRDASSSDDDDFIAKPPVKRRLKA